MYVCMYVYIYNGTWLSRPWLSPQPGFSPSLTFDPIFLRIKYLVKPPTWPLTLAMV